MSRIIIADPHGCYKTLMALIAKLPKGIPITFAGDLIDRGKNSKEVVEFVKNGGYDCVVGNHEVMMIDELRFKDTPRGERPYSDRYQGIWEMNGGDTTLDSYMTDGIEELASGEKLKVNDYDIKILKEHVEWMKTLPYFIEYRDLKNKDGNYLLVTHTTADRVWGKLPPDNPEFKNALVWDRDPWPENIPGVYAVFGHTPQKGVATVQTYFACIDTGAYFKREPYGKMTAFQFPEGILYEQENIED